MKYMYVLVYAYVNTKCNTIDYDVVVKHIFDDVFDAMAYVAKEYPEFKDYKKYDDILESEIKEDQISKIVSIQRVEYADSRNI